MKGIIVNNQNKNIKDFSVIIKDNDFKYKILLSGNLDENNTKYYYNNDPLNMVEDVLFQPNKYVIIENIGNNIVYSPKIIINGKRNWDSIENIINEVIYEEMTDEEKALRLFSFISSHSIQAHGTELRVDALRPNDDFAPSSKLNTYKERANPVKAINYYYCSSCYLSSANLAILARYCNLEARVLSLSNFEVEGTHCFVEIKYNGKYHLFDPEVRTFYLERDNKTIASYEYLHKNVSCVLRTRAHGFAAFKKYGTYFMHYRKYYPLPQVIVDQWISNLDFQLRPNEKIIYKWDHVEKYRYGNNPKKKPGIPYRLANGKIVYNPNLYNDNHKIGMLTQTNIIYIKNSVGPVIQKEIPGIMSSIIYKIHSPYPIVGGKIFCHFRRNYNEDIFRIKISWEDTVLNTLYLSNGLGDIKESIEIDTILDVLYKNAIYEYFIKIEFLANTECSTTGIDFIKFESDLQMSNTSLPALFLGDNNIIYSDKSNSRNIKITHAWNEEHLLFPPNPPNEPIYPKNCEKIDVNTELIFKWSASFNSNYEKVIKYYHIQISRYNDFLTPISPNFDVITYDSLPLFSIESDSFSKGDVFYWKVRSFSEENIWSNWSEIWEFHT